MISKSSVTLHLYLISKSLQPLRKFLFFSVICIAIAAIFLFSAKTGKVTVDFRDFWESLLNPNSENLAAVLIWQIRIPRFLSALFCGGCLALSGQLLQILVRNPLADSFTLGTGSGAALGINLALTGFLPPILSGIFFMPLWAFMGSFGAGLMVMTMAGSRMKQGSERLLLSGVAVSILANSIISLRLYFFSDQNEIRQMVFWAFGSLDNSSWKLLLPVSAFMIPAIGLVVAGSRTWNLMLLGEEKAISLGHPALRIRRYILILSSFLTACVVCLAGPLGFVGLVVPYFVRYFVPLGKKNQLLATFVSGAVFLAFCDLISRLLPGNSNVPTGLICSLVGLPLFLYLLQNSERRSFS
jgi:iron complex transport system permease protein